MDKKGASVTWDCSKAGTDEESLNSDRLHLRQILLGHTAKEGEYNVIEVSFFLRFFGEIIRLRFDTNGVLLLDFG